MKSTEARYRKNLADRSFTETEVSEKFQKLDVSGVDPFQVKAAILLLSKSIDDLDDLIATANEDPRKVLNWAQVMDDRTN